MKKGFVFSILVAMLLGFFILTMQYYLVGTPNPEIFSDFQTSQEYVTRSVANDLSEEFPISVERTSHVVITQTMPFVASDGVVTRWTNFMELYTNYSQHNISIDATNSSYLASGFWLGGNGDYVVSANQFTLNHSGSYLLVNNTMGIINYTVCALDGAGSVETRIIIDTFDTGVKYTTAGSSYYCYANFSDGKEVNVTINTNNDLVINYSNAPVNFTQRIGFDSDSLHMVFDKYNKTTSGINPGWIEQITGNKNYATVGGMNFVVADINTDGNYDYVFVDANANGNFTDSVDLWYLKPGITSLNGKVFYIQFDLGGNWITAYNALGVQSSSNWKGVEF